MHLIENFDHYVLEKIRKYFIPFSRFALFIVFFWFGILKLYDISPANPLVAGLLEQTLPFITFATFIKIFAGYEMLIGIVFLIPGLERFAILLLIPHMITTMGPLVLLPEVTWQKWFVPTLEGQYIIKNLVIIATAMGIAASLKPMKDVIK